MKPMTAAGLVIAGYIVSIVLCSPISIFAEHMKIQHHDLELDRTYCTEQWPSQISRKLYAVATLTLHFIVPLSLIMVLYCLVFEKLQGRVKKRLKHQKSTLNGQHNGPSSRTTKMLVAVVLVFAISWCPYHVFVLVAELHYKSVKGRWFKFIDVILRGVAISSACINPFLYGWYNDNYRASFYCICSRMCGAKYNEGSARITGDGADGTTKPNSGQSDMFSRFKESIRATSLRILIWRRQGSDESAISQEQYSVKVPVKRPIGPISSYPPSAASGNSRHSSRFPSSASPALRSKVQAFRGSWESNCSYDGPQSYQNCDDLDILSPTSQISIQSEGNVFFDESPSDGSGPVKHINVNVQIRKPTVANERTPLQ